MKIGLLVVDMQKGFLTGKIDQKRIDHACEYINYVSDLMRKHGHLVVHIQDMESAADMTEDELDFVEGIHREPADLLVQKIQSNAFWETGLEDILKKAGIDLVVVSGFAAEYCVLFTYNGAVERGFKTAMLQNGVVGKHGTSIAEMCRDRNLISYPVIEAICSETNDH